MNLIIPLSKSRSDFFGYFSVICCVNENDEYVRRISNFRSSFAWRNSYTVVYFLREMQKFSDLSAISFESITSNPFSPRLWKTGPPKFLTGKVMENEIAPFTYSGSSAGVVGMRKSHGDQSGGSVGSPSLLCDRFFNSSRNVMQQQRQDMVNREALCYTRLQEASLEAKVLRLENAELRSMNLHLKKELNQLIRSRLDYDRVPLRMLSNLSIGGNRDADDVENQNRNADDVSEESPTSVTGNEDQSRSSLPKSISVRSSGYSKASQGGVGTAQSGKSRGTMPKPGTCGQQHNSTVTISSLFSWLLWEL